MYQRVEYLWLNDTPVAQVRMDYVADAVSAWRLTYIHADHLNTPRAMSDSTQAIVWRWDGDAFGALPPNNDPDGNLLVDKLALRFPGQLYDQDSGLNINGFREYDPSLGRYALQSDPIGLVGGLNTYSYSLNSPVNYFDPAGLTAEGAATGAAIGGAVGGMLGGLGGAGGGTLVAPGIGTVGGGVAGATQGAIEGAAVGAVIGNAISEACKKDDKFCPPCVPPEGTIRYRQDVVPPSKPHWPYTGTHYHLFQMNQNPKTCTCFWNKIGVTDVPPPGAAPM